MKAQQIQNITPFLTRAGEEAGEQSIAGKREFIPLQINKLSNLVEKGNLIG
ncbi:hypothetical protein [Paenibacillus graminis]|uniref:hypothetical protein n=1 Tax=Paenibacillus graminis TaxID=189425 RepID=UPI0012DD2431|nr:hypothetical protein [Paenibacillus graminis]